MKLKDVPVGSQIETHAGTVWALGVMNTLDSMLVGWKPGETRLSSGSGHLYGWTTNKHMQSDVQAAFAKYGCEYVWWIHKESDVTVISAPKLYMGVDLAINSDIGIAANNVAINDHICYCCKRNCSKTDTVCWCCGNSPHPKR